MVTAGNRGRLGGVWRMTAYPAGGCHHASPGRSPVAPGPGVGPARSGWPPCRSRRPATRATTTTCCHLTPARRRRQVKSPAVRVQPDRHGRSCRRDGDVCQRDRLHASRHGREPGVGLARRRGRARQDRQLHLRPGRHVPVRVRAAPRDVRHDHRRRRWRRRQRSRGPTRRPARRPRAPRSPPSRPTGGSSSWACWRERCSVASSRGSSRGAAPGARHGVRRRRGARRLTVRHAGQIRRNTIPISRIAVAATNAMMPTLSGTSVPYVPEQPDDDQDQGDDDGPCRRGEVRAVHVRSPGAVSRRRAGSGRRRGTGSRARGPSSARRWPAGR